MLPPNFGAGHYCDGTKDSYKEDKFPISYYAGLINTNDVARFERMAFRISRGNIFFQKKDVECTLVPHQEQSVDDIDLGFLDPKTKKPIRKTLIFMLFMGADNLLSRRLKVLVSTFDVFCVEINPNPEARQTALIEQRQK